MRILRRLVFIAPTLALLGGFLLGAPNAAAQEREPVDLELSMTNRYRGNLLDGVFVVSVKNNSPVTVRNIRVQFEVDDLTEGRTIYLIDSKPPSVTMYRNDGSLNVDTLEWVIPELRSGLSAHTRLNTDQAKNAQTTPDQPLLLRLRGGIVDSSPPEGPGRLGNNQARTYVRYTYTNDVIAGVILITSLMYGVDANADAGTFTVKVRNRNKTLSAWSSVTSFQYQLRVRVTPSPGLRLAATPPSGTSFNPSTGIWDLGTLNTNTAPEGNRSLEIQVTGRDARAGPAEDQCLTVEIEHIIPDLEEPYLPETACMAHKTLITAGPFDIFDWRDCLTGTDYPCSNQRSLELVAVKSAYQPPHVDSVGAGTYDIGDVHRARFRTDVVSPGNDTKNMVLQPEEVVVQVPDNAATRVTESGNTVWSTVDLFNLYIGQRGFDSTWSGFKESVTVSGLDGTGWPGRWRMRGSNFDFLDAPDSNKAEAMPYDTSVIPQNGFTDFRIEFGRLGTYVALFEIEATKAGMKYTDSATYTFHVGPVAELEVRDAGPNPAVPGDRRAYTIAARNQGPDTAPAVEVALSGVPQGARVIASQGSYAPDTGIWRIDEMDSVETRRSTGQSDEETLTIISEDGAPAPITATISNTQDYSVCIDSSGNDVDASSESECTGGGHSWNSAEYYDYLDHNNTATIAAQLPTGEGDPDAPRSLRVDKFGSLALLRWQPPESGRVNRFGITHYQVERNGVTLADDVTGIMYADLRGDAVNQSYRVRAVNNWGVPGPWSLPSTWVFNTPAAPNGLGLTAAPGAGVGRIDLSWSAPSGETGLSYRIEYSFDGADPWTRLRTQSGTTYSHTGLLLGVTYHYRVAAFRGNLMISPWAYIQATTEGVQVDVPDWPMNLRFTSIDRTAVTLAWDPPHDDEGNEDSTVTGYEYRVFGPCPSGSDGVCDIVAPRRVSGTSVRIGGLNREGTYEFSVRALNAVGAGDWSQSITKKVDPQTAGGGRVILSHSRLTVSEGGEATYRVRLSTSPTLPLWVVMHWDGTGDENLGGGLATQQFKILLPTGYDTTGLPEWCDEDPPDNPNVRLDWSEAYAWNVGVPITVVAAEDDDSKHERLTIQHDVNTVPHDCLNMAEGDWSPDPVYDGMQGPALTVTERDND